MEFACNYEPLDLKVNRSLIIYGGPNPAARTRGVVYILVNEVMVLLHVIFIDLLIKWMRRMQLIESKWIGMLVCFIILWFWNVHLLQRIA